MYSLGFFWDMQIGIAVLYLLYRLIIRGRVPLYAARAYLLLIAPVAAMVAAVKLPVLDPVVYQLSATTFEVPAQTDVPMVVESAAVDYVLWGYILVAAAVVLWSLVGLARIVLWTQRHEREGDIYFCGGDVVASSFFSLIFVGERYRNSDSLEAIIAHERFHRHYLHSLDLIYVNLLRAVLWINPAAWFIGRSLGEVHELQADRAVMVLGFSPVRYIETLLSAQVGFLPAVPNSLTNSFSYSITKNRIKMITKFNSPLSAWRLAAVVPVVALMMGTMSFTRAADVYLPAPELVDVAQIPPAKKVDEKSASPTKYDVLSITPIVNPNEVYYVLNGKQITKEQFEKLPDGKAVTKTQTNGQPGYYKLDDEAMKPVFEKIRNPKPESPPLIILDGKEIAQGAMEKIDPEIIASMSIFKDGSAIKKYGEKGRNGVILITSKSSSGNTGDAITVVGYGSLSYVPLIKEALRENGATKVTYQHVEQSDDKDAPNFSAEVMPKFNSGTINDFKEWVSQRVIYPKEAAEKGIQGRVHIEFVIEKDGSVGNVGIMRGVSRQIDSVIVSTVKLSPKWTPGTNKGAAVRVKYMMPIDFTLK